MKRALINSNEPGRICEVVDIGNEFEVHNAFSWIDVPDDTTTHDRYENGSVVKFNILELPGFADQGYKVARTIAYSSFGDQLDMLFKEIQATGTISNTGPWATHVAAVKAAIPKDDPAAVQQWNQQYWAQLQANI